MAERCTTMNDHMLAAWTRHAPLVLLVDRDGDTRRMYAEYLALSQCAVDEAEDGREALAKAISTHPNVIIMETRLPGISGFDLCLLLRNDPQTADIPIIVVTADAYEVHLHRAQTVGADAVLVKPCLPETLLAEIHRLLDQGSELHRRSAGPRAPIGEQRVAPPKAPDREDERGRGLRVILSRAHHRHDTTTPPAPPPALVCSQCDQPLRYVRSHVGGVSERHVEQWDYFECAACTATYQYRQRTKRVRRL